MNSLKIFFKDEGTKFFIYYVRGNAADLEQYCQDLGERLAVDNKTQEPLYFVPIGKKAPLSGTPLIAKESVTPTGEVIIRYWPKPSELDVIKRQALQEAALMMYHNQAMADHAPAPVAQPAETPAPEANLAGQTPAKPAPVNRTKMRNQ